MEALRSIEDLDNFRKAVKKNIRNEEVQRYKGKNYSERRKQ